MKENLNIQFFHIYASLILAIRYLIYFSFFFCVECDTQIIQNIWKYEISLVNACERFFLLLQ